MANALYPKFKEQALQGGVSLASGNIKAVLVDLADYTYDAAHEFLSDVPAAARVATSGNLASKTFTNGVFDSADPSFTAVTGDVSEALILFIDTGTPGTSRLIAFYDTGVSGLPVTPNGGNISNTVNASGWFGL
ncbi:MAG: hypothetical protein ING00_17635 [Roseomonas sp.]|nr:hypothetical protein [Roseomonas sp.]